MRVLLLGPYPPPHGGVQSNLVAIRNLLRRKGHYAGVINLTRYRSTDGDDVYYPKSPWELIGLLLRLRYDLVHLHFGGNLTRRLLGLSLLASSIPRVKSVLTFHSGGYPCSPAGRAARPTSLPGFIFRRFDRIIGVNGELVDLFVRWGVPKERVKLVLPHAVVLPEKAALPEAVSGFFARHNPRILTVSGLEPEYDIPLQLRALGDVRRHHPEAGLLILGGGSLEGQIREQIASLSYRDHVLLCGDVPHAATLATIAHADMMLRTTLYDGDAVSVREALHLGTPVIATDNGMRPPGPRLIPISDRDALVRAILDVTKDPAGRTAPRADQDEENIQKVIELYTELLTR
jgi:glycogen synthase